MSAALTATLLTAACTSVDLSDTAVSTPGAAPSQDAQPTADAAIERLKPSQWRAMRRAGMVRPECPIQDPDRLRQVSVNYVTFEGEIRRGRLIVNRDVGASVARIFTKLFDERFPIRRMQPVDAFGGDTNRSLRADNTSAFNCRRADQINAPFIESPHANGRAIDINPRENPWKDLRCRCWLPSAQQRARTEGPGKIVRGALVWRLFRAEGWIWQNIDVPDYMHFDTGYPSGPFRSRARG